MRLPARRLAIASCCSTRPSPWARPPNVTLLAALRPPLCSHHGILCVDGEGRQRPRICNQRAGHFDDRDSGEASLHQQQPHALAGNNDALQTDSRSATTLSTRHLASLQTCSASLSSQAPGLLGSPTPYLSPLPTSLCVAWGLAIAWPAPNPGQTGGEAAEESELQAKDTHRCAFLLLCRELRQRVP